jgi:hypothetical protein
MCPPRPSDKTDSDLPPGAERFWGQMSKARPGHTDDEDASAGEPKAPAGEREPDQGHECLEWCPVCRSAELLQAAASPEVRQQLQAIQGEAISILRAFAAAYAERVAENPVRRTDAQAEDGPGPVVTDISID